MRLIRTIRKIATSTSMMRSVVSFACLAGLACVSSSNQSLLEEEDRIREIALAEMIEIVRDEYPRGDLLGRSFCIAIADLSDVEISALGDSLSSSADPSEELLASVKARVRSARKASDCGINAETGSVTGAGILKKGILVWVGPLKQLRKTEIELRVGYHVRFLDSAGYDCRVAKDEGTWAIEHCKLRYIS